MVMFGALLLTGITIFLVLQPILAGRQASLASREQEVTDAQFRKRAALLQLRDAEYEFAMGKLGEEDYQALKGQLSAEALAAIRAEKEEASGAETGAGDEDLEAEIARTRAKIKGGVFCSQCGTPNGPGSRFCSECGSPLATPQPSGSA